VDPSVEIDRELVKKYPREYGRCLSLAKGGFPVKRVFATTGSGVEMTTKADGQACWRLDAASRISIPTVRLLVSQ
jgi:hypothetical protein